jgi:hypothetical protein
MLCVMETDGGYDRGSGSPEQRAQVIRLRPLRVLIVSVDHRFRAVIEMLIARRGCSVFSLSAPDCVARTVIDERVDVVLVDGAGALREVAQDIARSDASLPPVGVVLVTEREEPSPPGWRSLAKWGPFDELFDLVLEADRARSPAPGTDRASASGPHEVPARDTRELG